MSNSKLDLLQESMDRIVDDLVSHYPKNQLPEHLFVSNFLPFFKGEIDLSKNKDFLPTWISIAGSPTAEVDIINVKGEVIFTVPSFMDTSVVNSKKSSGLNFNEIITMAQLWGNNIPAQGAKVLDGELTEKFKRLTSKSSVHDTNYEKWNKIFSRYPSTKVDSVVKDSVVKKATMSNVTDDDFE